MQQCLCLVDGTLSWGLRQWEADGDLLDAGFVGQFASDEGLLVGLPRCALDRPGVGGCVGEEQEAPRSGGCVGEGSVLWRSKQKVVKSSQVQSVCPVQGSAVALSCGG